MKNPSWLYQESVMALGGVRNGSVSQCVYKSKCPSVCVSVCSLFEVPFNHLFAPTSQSWMSKMFRDSESLGKSSGKKWSQIWTSLFQNGLKLTPQIFFFLQISFSFVHFWDTVSTSFCPKFPKCCKCLKIRNPWGKVLERNGLRCEHFCSKMV